jgi:hypothetical protein
MARRQVTNEKRLPTMPHASLCGRSNLLKAPGFVAGYLTIVIFYRTNDNEDSNWFKPDGIWFKVAKRRFVVEQEHATE